MSKQNNAQAYNKILGVQQPTGVPMETVEIKVSFEAIADDYVKFFVVAARAKNSDCFDASGLTQDELKAYCNYLLYQRILCVEGNCREWRKLKLLWIPSYLQHVLTMVGEVFLYDRGLHIVPVFDGECTLTFEEAQAISFKLGLLSMEVNLVQDAMPRGTSGDPDCMSCVLIADYIRSLNPVQHVASTYIAAFINATLKKETAFKALYRVQYDDVSYIRSALTTDGELY